MQLVHCTPDLRRLPPEAAISWTATAFVWTFFVGGDFVDSDFVGRRKRMAAHGQVARRKKEKNALSAIRSAIVPFKVPP